MKHQGMHTPLQLLATQPSHVLLVMSNARVAEPVGFASVVRAQQYEQHEVDITCGRHMRFPYRHLGLYHLSLDGAEQAAELIEHIQAAARERNDAELPATWLFYPISEKVGRAPGEAPAMVTIAFANPVPGHEAEFREWYSTRHIRHALNIPALVSGQCFERALYQSPGAADCGFALIALYEQEGTPESIIDSFANLPKGALNFPTMDKTRGRFAECVYRPLPQGR